eukprot:CAMPEP_0114253128 /NCGR_PEP_ID=MMETSP0058-20121206/16221_1 /TAXON_ID=36894 /ORGANISM="Pyramimonas parkeae, CCMP726" /LENGTH=142 /DNA_ID=CAMNT_0001367141 /DNA_START=291 /DNA_END=719 /DNA_ORIENTATION=+
MTDANNWDMEATDLQEHDMAERDHVGETRAKCVKQRLQLAVVEIIESEAEARNLNLAKSVVTAITGLTTDFVETLAKDLLLFSHHAKRSTVATDDVLLAARRNASVHNLLVEKSSELGVDLDQPTKRRRHAKGKAPASTTDF